MRMRILGFEVHTEPVFFLVAAFLGLSRLSQPLLLLSWIAVVFVSVLVHELGHALAFRRLGYAPNIRLHAMGGHTSAHAALTPTRDIVVSLAGPALGLALGGLTYVASLFLPPSPWLAVVVADLLWVNIGWSIINLLPILPMDGGRVLVAVLRRRDPRGGESLAHKVSMVVAGVAAALAAMNGMIFAALMAVMFAVDNHRASRAAHVG